MIQEELKPIMNKVKTLVSKHNFAKVKNQVMEAYMVGVATASGHITVLDPKEKILNKVKIAIFKAFEVSLESTYPIGREREGADIRAIAAYHLYPQYGTYTEIGELFGGRKHSSILLSIRKYKNNFKYNTAFRYKATLVIKHLKDD